ncbi:TauD/TfdA family dioxygenase [Sphingobium sp.]|uniref:TauD/TfdA dioxygenase family protein n=1 Tax=Sphingobium sp. TaxID=1912891 RepID=UPI0028BF43EA|nr:TauD/TfdA family dioxygenase [Sphingobium sp.]
MSGHYEHITVEPVSGALGAEISGVDLSQPLRPEVLAEIKRAFHENLVIYFHDQAITPAQQCDFARNFGPLTKHPFIKTLPGFPEVAPLIRDADNSAKTLNFGGLWHIDVTFMECPPLGSMLYAVDPPPFGGDTLFSNLYLAYETLSPGMRELADRLIVVHTAAVSYDPDRGADDDAKSKVKQKGMQFDINADVSEEMDHPLVRIHPETGRKLLFINAGYQIRFKDMTEAESQPLFDFFLEHARRPEFTCRFRYRKGTLGFWDNRCTQHFAVNDYGGWRREMHRVQIGGDRPYGPAMPLLDPSA